MTDQSAKESENAKEARILRLTKMVLTDVVKDTATGPGMKHPLSDRTIENIRQCLSLIAARERELSEAAGRTMSERPQFADEPRTSTVVPLSKISIHKKTTNSSDD